MSTNSLILFYSKKEYPHQARVAQQSKLQTLDERGRLRPCKPTKTLPGTGYKIRKIRVYKCSKMPFPHPIMTFPWVSHSVLPSDSAPPSFSATLATDAVPRGSPGEDGHLHRRPLPPRLPRPRMIDQSKLRQILRNASSTKSAVARGGSRHTHAPIPRCRG